MIEWTPEAGDFLAGYLQQVGALARHQGDDAEEITAGLHDHIVRETEADAGTLVTLERLQKALATVGTPEQVTSVDSPFATRAAALETATRPPVATAVAVPKQRARWPWLVPLWIVVLVPLCIFLLVMASILAAILLPSMARAREAARRNTCQNNLKQMGIVLDMFAGENERVYPPLSPEPGRWMFNQEQLYPRFLADPRFLICPGDADAAALLRGHDPDEALVDDHSYLYLGYALRSEEDLNEFIALYTQTVQDGGDFTKDLVTPGGKTMYRLGQKATRVLAENDGPAAMAVVASETPVLIERPDNHVPRGGNVLYLDGHVQLVKMGNFPMIQEFLDALESFEQ